MPASNLFRPLRLAFVSSYPPRQCGIATFTADLMEAMCGAYGNGNVAVNSNGGAPGWSEVIALDNTAEGYSYGPEVSFHVREQYQGDYYRAADFINFSPVDLVCLQHEFGLYGGDDGSHVLHLLSNLRKPVVTVLHTVLLEPTPGQRLVLNRVCELSSLVVVQAERAVQYLRRIYGVPGDKIMLIYHGAPDVPFLDSSYYKEQFQAEGRRVLLTFGLLGPGKGLEYVIAAMEQIVAVCPEALYIILGATHPEVKRRYGEQYRHSLEKTVREKGLVENVVFYNQYVSLERLVQFLVATDIYITPYENSEQIVSGTLTYAVACGKAVISTPFQYARELLAGERGLLVPFRDSTALAEAALSLLRDEELRNYLRKQAYMFGRQMIWPEAGRAYAGAFEAALHNYGHGLVPSIQSVAVTEKAALPEVNLQHLRNLTDDTGLFQHAVYTVPDRVHGYCSDDNARALIVATMNWQLFKDESILLLFRVYLSFLHHALDRASGRFRNFLAYERSWTEKTGSEDSHGRSLWALGYSVAYPPDDPLLNLSMRLFKTALPAAIGFTSPRAWAYTILGSLCYLKRFGGDAEVRALVMQLAGRLDGLYQAVATEEWSWFENIVSYDNACLAHALIWAGHYLDHEEHFETGLRALEWLLQVQTAPEGHLSLIGNRDWYRQGGKKARYDQQPLDAAALVEACYRAYRTTEEMHWQVAMEQCFNWFFGNNDGRQSLYDFVSGGCFDGLEPGAVNQNQGGESTVSLLIALHRMHLAAVARLAEAPAGGGSDEAAAGRSE